MFSFQGRFIGLFECDVREVQAKRGMAPVRPEEVWSSCHELPGTVHILGSRPVHMRIQHHHLRRARPENQVLARLSCRSSANSDQE